MVGVGMTLGLFQVTIGGTLLGVGDIMTHSFVLAFGQVGEAGDQDGQCLTLLHMAGVWAMVGVLDGATILGDLMVDGMLTIEAITMVGTVDTM